MADRGLNRLTVGGYAITMKDIAGFDPRDVYHLVVGLSWPRFVLLAVGMHLLVNTVLRSAVRCTAWCGCERACRILRRRVLLQRGDVGDRWVWRTVSGNPVWPHRLYNRNFHWHCANGANDRIAVCSILPPAAANHLRGKRRHRAAPGLPSTHDQGREWPPAASL